MQWWGACPPEWSGRAAARGGSGLPEGLEKWPEVGCLKLWGRAWRPQELGVGGRGRGARGGARGVTWALRIRVPRDATASARLRTDAHFPLFMLLQDSHSFQLCTPGTFHRLCLNQSLLCGLPGGQPCLSGPIAWGWGFRSQNGVPQGFLPALTALGVKVGARRGVGGAHSRGYPQCLPEVSKMGVGTWTLRAG